MGNIMHTTDRKLHVFLCHALQDKPVVRELHQRLLVEGWIDPWLDEEKLLPGQDWDMEIEKAVESSDMVIVCFSSASVTKDGYVQKELKIAIDAAERRPEGKIFLIPIRLDDCTIPRKLQAKHYIDYFPVSIREKSLQKLLLALRPPFDKYNEEQRRLAQELQEVNTRLQAKLNEIEELHNEIRSGYINLQDDYQRVLQELAEERAKKQKE